MPRPFASFSNPFRDGTAKHRSPGELVRYSFAALEAWAYEQELGRRPEETPFEFTERVALEVAPLEDDLRQLAGLFVRVAYAPGSVPANCLGALQQFWEHLEAAVEQPLSA